MSETGSSAAGNGYGYARDVFLSFRGEDTRNGFVGHLYAGLRRVGINAFIDEDGLTGGDEIAPSLLEAIEQSRISIVVLSKNYASSGWCLDELVKILGCKESTGQRVLPVFYKVDPSEVRSQSGNVGEALSHQEKKLGKDHEKVKRWKEALRKVSMIAGWHLHVDRREVDVVRKIIKRVLNDINRQPLHVPENLFAMDNHMDHMKSLLDIDSKDAKMVGVCGLGGIGKTTIAKATYNAIFQRFEHSAFITNVRETCKKYSQCGLLKLQKTLLSEMMLDDDVKFGNVDRGAAIIRNILSSKRVIVVIDDVDSLHQLETLVGKLDWYGSGSRIIVTTRDEHLLVAHGIDKLYKVKLLDRRAAMWLFSSAAFRNTVPEESFLHLSYDVVDHVKGLPLAIRVLGSFLRGRSESEWKCAIAKLKKIPHTEIFSVLKISFDGLDDYEKTIFLDLACFFKGDCVDHVKEILNCCDLFPENGIRVLVDRSLITVEFGKVEIHDMIEEMGKEIVRQESPQEPGERSRLWFHEDILSALTEKTATNKIEGIKLDMEAQEEVQFSSRAFSSMRRLRFFIAHNVHHSGDPIHLPNELKWLEWPEYTLPSLPFGPGPKKLAGMFMARSSIQFLGEEFQLFRNLKFINFSHCPHLAQIPDASSMRSLQRVDAEGCESLVDVHDSLGHLDKLVHMNFSNCSKLTNFPRSLKSKVLENLLLKGCLMLSKFPDILVEVKGMKELSLEETAIQELPYSFGNLVGLKNLSLKNCRKLKYIPNSIYKLSEIEYITLSGCSELNAFPENQESLDDFHQSSAFPKVIFMDFERCSLSEVNFLKGLQCNSTLTYLNLSRNKISCIPAGMGRFTKLQQLNLAKCRQLREIVELPMSITHLFAEGCKQLRTCPSLSSIIDFQPWESPWVRKIDFTGCSKLIHPQKTQLVFDRWEWSYKICRYSGGPRSVPLDLHDQGIQFQASGDTELLPDDASADESITNGNLGPYPMPNSQIQAMNFEAGPDGVTWSNNSSNNIETTITRDYLSMLEQPIQGIPAQVTRDEEVELQLPFLQPRKRKKTGVESHASDGSTS